MAVFAELHDGRRLEFPDGTDPAVIQSTVKRMVATASPAPAGPETPGIGETLLIAAGRGTDKLVKGVKQGYMSLRGDDAGLAKLAEEESENDRLYKPLQEARPFATAIGETAPMLAGGSLGASLKGAALVGALPGLVGYGSAEQRLARGATGAVGGLAGGLAGKGLARVLKPAGVGAEAVSDDAVAAAARLGYKPTAAQQTQNPAMLNLENYLARSPGSSGVMRRAGNAQQSALNKAGARAMGETADSLDSSVFGAANSRIGAEFNRLGAVTKPKLGDEFVDVLASIETSNIAKGPFANKEVTKLIDKGLALAAKGDLDGVAYKEIRTELSNSAKASFTGGDASTGQAYKKLVEALDDAAGKSLSEADRKAWDVARKEWAAFKTLSKSNVAEGGNLSAARTAAAIRSKDPGFRTGRSSGDLNDVARIGEAFKGPLNPNSGSLTQGMLYGNPFTGLPLMVGNRAAASAYMSKPVQQYLARGLLDVGPTGQMLLGRAGGQLAVPGVRGLLGVE